MFKVNGRPSKPCEARSIRVARSNTPAVVPTQGKPTGEAPRRQRDPGGFDSRTLLPELVRWIGAGSAKAGSWVRFPPSSPSLLSASSRSSTWRRTPGPQLGKAGSTPARDTHPHVERTSTRGYELRFAGSTPAMGSFPSSDGIRRSPPKADGARSTRAEGTAGMEQKWLAWLITMKTPGAVPGPATAVRLGGKPVPYAGGGGSTPPAATGV